MAAKVFSVRQLVAAKRASDETGIPYTSLRDHALKGEIPIVKIGRAWYFKRTDLAAFIKKQTARIRRSTTSREADRA